MSRAAKTDAQAVANLVYDFFLKMQQWGADFEVRYQTGSRLILTHSDGTVLRVAVSRLKAVRK